MGQENSKLVERDHTIDKLSDAFAHSFMNVLSEVTGSEPDKKLFQEIKVCSSTGINRYITELKQK